MINTRIMAILNATPNSFFAGSRVETLDDAVRAGIRFQMEGADFIDIGGESTSRAVYKDLQARPVTEEEELRRVLPIIEALKAKVAVPLSIDTVKPKVARLAIKAGASLINDISGFRDPQMVEAAGEAECDICLMHMQGTPETMQQNPFYEEGIIPHLLKWFEEKIHYLTSCGIKEEKIILDPGICFGKTVAHNFEIIQNLPIFKKMGFRLLLGISRKSFMAKTLNKSAEELLPATLAINTLAILSQVDILRVHDVIEHRDAIELIKACLQR